MIPTWVWYLLHAVARVINWLIVFVWLIRVLGDSSFLSSCIPPPTLFSLFSSSLLSLCLSLSLLLFLLHILAFQSEQSWMGNAHQRPVPAACSGRCVGRKRIWSSHLAWGFGGWLLCDVFQCAPRPTSTNDCYSYDWILFNVVVHGMLRRVVKADGVILGFPLGRQSPITKCKKNIRNLISLPKVFPERLRFSTTLDGFVDESPFTEDLLELVRSAPPLDNHSHPPLPQQVLQNNFVVRLHYSILKFG